MSLLGTINYALQDPGKRQPKNPARMENSRGGSTLAGHSFRGQLPGIGISKRYIVARDDAAPPKDGVVAPITRCASR